MSEQPIVYTERVDDVPLLLDSMQRLGLPTILDTHFPAHGNHQGLGLGWIGLVWLTHILSRADHRLNRVRPWADQLQTTINPVLPTALWPTDLTDDRLADVLHALSNADAWAACEGALNQHILRVYDLNPSTVRVDSTTASGYWLDVTLTETAHTHTIRPYRGQPAREEMTYALDVASTRVEAAITAAIARLGWRVYATNRTVADLDTIQVVLAYRDQYLVEQPMGRLKGAPLSLSPVSLSRDDAVACAFV